MVYQDTVARDVLGDTPLLRVYLCLLPGGVSGHSSKRCVGGYTMTESASVFVFQVVYQNTASRDVLVDTS